MATELGIRPRRMLTAAVVAAVLLLAAPAASPVTACSGVAFIGDDLTDPEAHVVFNGTAVDVADPRLPFDPVVSSGDLMEWTFVVDGVEKGDVPAVITVLSERFGASCGYPFELGSRYRVVATDRGRGLHTGQFMGNEKLDPLPDPPSVEFREGRLDSLGLLALVPLALASLAIFIGLVRRRTGPPRP